MRIRPLGSLLAISTLALTALTACASGSPASQGAKPAEGSALSVVSTTTQVSEFARIVGGDRVQVTALIQPNASAHHFDPTAADLIAIGRAEVLVMNGLGLESWIDSAKSVAGFKGQVIDASALLVSNNSILSDDDGHGEGDADGHSDHGAEGHEDHDHDHEPGDHGDEGHGHVHEGGNPHIWTDPINAKSMVTAIADGFVKADPSSEATYRANAKTYIDKLTSLDHWIASNVSAVPEAERLVVSNHDAFSYFLERYDIQFVGSIIPSFEDNAEPSGAQIDELIKKVKALGVKAIFSESSISDKQATRIAAASGVAVYSGDDALFGDSLGAPGSAGDTYLKATIHNTTLILRSWGKTATALPAELES